MSRLPAALAVAAMVLPVPAFADCATRIDVVESHPAFATNSDQEQTESAPAAPGNEEEVVQKEMVEKGDSVQENGGETVYADGGPATPVENWFVPEENKVVVLTHLDTAKKAHEAGDESACIEAIEQAETALEADAG